jgi:hypothetical protein
MSENISQRQSDALQKAIDETLERIALEALGEAPYRHTVWTWRDRIELAWSVLRGRITWDDIQ